MCLINIFCQELNNFHQAEELLENNFLPNIFAYATNFNFAENYKLKSFETFIWPALIQTQSKLSECCTQRQASHHFNIKHLQILDPNGYLKSTESYFTLWDKELFRVIFSSDQTILNIKSLIFIPEHSYATGTLASSTQTTTSCPPSSTQCSSASWA